MPQAVARKMGIVACLIAGLASRGEAREKVSSPPGRTVTPRFAAVGDGAPRVVVALDPGHGGTNLGASGVDRGVYEKRVTLALVQRIRTLLEQPLNPKNAAEIGPEIVVVLCRESDVLVPIRARARCAQESGARAFVSIHANAVPVGVRPGSQHGFEVFVLGPREVEDDALLATMGRPDDAEAAWAAHEVRAAAEQSVSLGRDLADALTQALGTDARRGVKQSGAALDVLRGTGTAAALVEVGFLDHPDEGARLATPSGREPIAAAIAAAIRGFVAHDTVAAR